MRMEMRTVTRTRRAQQDGWQCGNGQEESSSCQEDDDEEEDSKHVKNLPDAKWTKIDERLKSEWLAGSPPNEAKKPCFAGTRQESTKSAETRHRWPWSWRWLRNTSTSTLAIWSMKRSATSATECAFAAAPQLDEFVQRETKRCSTVHCGIHSVTVY